MEPDEPPSDRLALSPEEEDAFAAIAFGLGDREPAGIPWRVVAISVSLVGIAVLGAALLGAPEPAVILFFVTFAVALALGILALAVADRGSRHL